MTCFDGVSPWRRSCCPAGGWGVACTDPNLRQSCSCENTTRHIALSHHGEVVKLTIKGLREDVKLFSTSCLTNSSSPLRAAFVVNNAGGADIHLVFRPRQNSHQSGPKGWQRAPTQTKLSSWGRISLMWQSVKEMTAQQTEDESVLYSYRHSSTESRVHHLLQAGILWLSSWTLREAKNTLYMKGQAK